MPKLTNQELFEQEYTGRFRALAGRHGIFIDYPLDRAGIDIGLQLVRRGVRVSEVLEKRVWFQLKGITKGKLPQGSFNESNAVYVDIPIDLLRYWYAQPEPVYLAVYIESQDVFVAEDVRDIVETEFQGAIFRDDFFREGQKTARVAVPTSAVLDGARFESMDRHRSLRIDGPTFRGRPLGHRFDPLRSELDAMHPKDYDALCDRLLRAYDFRPAEELDASALFAADTQVEGVRLVRGTMYQTYEWTHPMFTEFGYDLGSDFRIEGQMFQVQGPVAIVVHSDVRATPLPSEAGTEVMTGLREDHDVDYLMVLSNASESSKTIGAWRQVARPLSCIPQDLGSLTFNVLTTTLVFLEMRPKLRWNLINYL